MKIKVAVFASGSGSNAETIANYFHAHTEIAITLFLTNNKTAGVIERGHRLGIPTLVFDKKLYKDESFVVDFLKSQSIDYVVLAGFLWLIPSSLIQAFPNRIINIHPALLPKYGGKGMWGHHVHEAVVANKEEESGITIHLVNEHYDEGKILFQAKCPIESTDSGEDVAAKVLKLEHEYLPKVVESYILKIAFGLPNTYLGL